MVPISEVSVSQAAAYLRHKGVEGRTAVRLAGLVGGRFHHLEKVAAMIGRGMEADGAHLFFLLHIVFFKLCS